jgi:hypothetical protein
LSEISGVVFTSDTRIDDPGFFLVAKHLGLKPYVYSLETRGAGLALLVAWGLYYLTIRKIT